MKTGKILTMLAVFALTAVLFSCDRDNLSVQPEANGYMVAPGSAAILIPVSQANKAADPDYNLGADATGLGGVTADNYTVELVWGDTPVGEDGVIRKLETYAKNGKGYIRIEPGVAGNAVICIKDKTSGAVKWSWHIWVTEAITSKKDDVTGLTWMDRNLGAAGTTYDADGRNGLFYQWGRKDAFPASDGMRNNQAYYTGNSTGTTAALPTGEYTELPELVQNPLGFATNYDTYSGSLNVAGDMNNSWGGVSGVKTLYDPCPPGWKVPPIQVNSVNSWGKGTAVDSGEWTFTDYISTNKGVVFNGVNGTSALGHFYPASSFRGYDSGTLGVGMNGYCWSASIIGRGGYYLGNYLGFDITSVNTANYIYRTPGLSVRCISE